MVDLKSQYLKIKPEIDNAIQNVIDSCQFVKGNDVKAFELELALHLQVKNVITCGNGTDALQVALMALGLKPGDEVITTDFTFIATVEVIALLGLTPILVDVNPKTFNIDIESVKKAISPKTKAIVPVHLFGQCADMEPLLKIAEEFGLYIVEDTAQGLGAEYRFSDGTIKKAGTMGNIGCTSFFPSKNLGCYGDGGAVFTDNDEWASLMDSYRVHGKGSDKYQNVRIGMNSRLDTIQAAVLLEKFKAFKEWELTDVNIAAGRYNERLEGVVPVPVVEEGFGSSWAQYAIRLESSQQRERVQKALNEQDIPTMVYYPLPMHRQQAFAGLSVRNCPVADRLCETVLSLPMHPYLTEEQIDTVCTALKAAL